MGFEKIHYLYISIASAILFIAYKRNYFVKFSSQVKSYWFYDLSVFRKISLFLYALSFLVLAIAVGDLRGKEEMIEASIPTQKTIVLIDNSLSMLVEDIRPNRIKKAVFLARHFITNSFGHQVSIAVFSDIFKSLVPFTDDIEILDARLRVINDGTPIGGSNLSLAMNEALQYFKSKDGYVKGNILVLTDGEEHTGVNLDIPDEISVAVIGVGSEGGGKIPLRRKDGQFSSYKQFRGKEVESKLYKPFFDKIISSGKNIKVWYASSYSLPTNEILDFFAKVHEESFQKGSFRQRPVAGIPIILAFIALYSLSFIFSRFKTFRAPVLIFLLSISTFQNKSFAQGKNDNLKNLNTNEDSQKELDPRVIELNNKFKKGTISRDEKLELAEKLLPTNEKQSAEIYRSTLKDLDKEKVEDIFNFSTSLLKQGNVKDSISLYKYLDRHRDISDEMREVIKKNINFALNRDNKNKDKNKDKNQDKNQDKNKNKNQDNQNGDNQNDKSDQQKGEKGDNQDSSGQGGDGSQSDDQKENSGKNQQNSKDTKDSNNNKDKKSQNSKSAEEYKDNREQDKNSTGQEDSKDDKNEENKNQDQQKNGDESDDKKDGDAKEGEKPQQQAPQSWEDIQKAAQLKKRKGVKGVLKQILDEDGILQKKFIDSSRQRSSTEEKDW